MLVSSRCPYKVLGIEQEIVGLFGYTLAELRECDVSILLGSKSDFSGVYAAIEGVNCNEVCRLKTILYDRHGNEKLTVVKFAPYYHTSAVIACRMSFRSPYDMTFGRAPSISMAQSPPTASYSSVLGQSLPTCSRLMSSSSESGPGEDYTHIQGYPVGLQPALLRFPPTSKTRTILLPSGARAVAPRVRLPLPAYDSAGDSDGPLPQPILITTELLAALRGLPLPRAARAVGISATAFKRACRRLGLRRWDYKRGPGRAGRGYAAAIYGRRPAAPAPAAPVSPSPAGPPDSPDSEAGWGAEGDVLIGEEWGDEDELSGDGGAEDDALVLDLLARPWPA